MFAVFAMHTLTTERAHSCHTAALPLIGGADETQHAHTGVSPGDAAHTPDSPGHASRHDHGGAEETCLALLCVVGALLAFGLGRGASHRVLYVLHRGAPPAHSWISRTGDPPCLHRLSILRC
ncbi:hypothetical protein ACGFMM_10300 [Streptomyces sp. NPDC048604]|uniref:hypothetical protein n=1 Tax=Streptomyces sp. NPDC048604 TaxID=3365578 RepID=UPI003720E378